MKLNDYVVMTTESHITRVSGTAPSVGLVLLRESSCETELAHQTKMKSSVLDHTPRSHVGNMWYRTTSSIES